MESSLRQKAKESDTLSNLFALIAIMAGMLLVSLGVHLRSSSFISAALGTLGVAVIVSVSTSFLHRRYVHTKALNEMQTEVERSIGLLLNKRFDVLRASDEVGIRHLYPKWAGFCENSLPAYLEGLKEQLTVVGVALSGLAQLFHAGTLRDLVNKQLRAGKRFVVCVVDPASEAVTQREKEVGQRKTALRAIQSSLAFLEDIRRNNPGSNLEIRVLRTQLPKAAMISVDDELMFYSPYLSAQRTPLSWVLETHHGDDFFRKLQRDLQHLLKDSEEWPLQASGGDSREHEK